MLWRKKQKNRLGSEFGSRFHGEVPYFWKYPIFAIHVQLEGRLLAQNQLDPFSCFSIARLIPACKCDRRTDRHQPQRIPRCRNVYDQPVVFTASNCMDVGSCLGILGAFLRIPLTQVVRGCSAHRQVNGVVFLGWVWWIVYTTVNPTRIMSERRLLYLSEAWTVCVSAWTTSNW